MDKTFSRASTPRLRISRVRCAVSDPGGRGCNHKRIYFERGICRPDPDQAPFYDGDEVTALRFKTS